MKFTKFEISEYRAINNITVDLNHQLLPLVGVNESGKTSILQALLAYDRGQDKLNNGYHLEYSNRYNTISKQNCRISAHILFDDKDYNNLVKSIRTKSDNPVFDILSEHRKEKKTFVLTRVLSQVELPYELDYPKIEDSTIRSRIIKYILSNQPYILYFDDFTDRVPSEVTFNEEYLESGKIRGRKGREWQYIIEEIFNRSGAEGFDENDESIKPLQEFMNLTEKDVRDGVLYDITDVLERDIISEWKKMKKEGLNNLADDSDKLELLINYDETNYTFEFKVRDKSKEGRKRIFNVTQRSKGFQWFFNFIVKLKFNPRYKGTIENSIFLLDEPGSYLHASAQMELLKELETVSRTNTLLYCTHSHYLLDPNIIKLGSIRIAEKENALISLTNYGDFKGKNINGALSPIYQALQMNIANDFVGKIVIFEGITDFYFFKLIQRYSNHIPNDLKLIAGSGSGASTTLISLGLSFAENFVVVFDNDKGTKAIKKYTKEFTESIRHKFHVYGKKDASLEDLLDEKDAKYLLDNTEVNELKKSFGIFFYDKKEKHKSFVKNLSKETIINFQETFDTLNSL